MARISDPGAARAYIGSVLSGGGYGRPRKPPEAWTDAYAVRLANAWQRQSGAGVPLTRQAARGHATTPEHPREFVIRSVPSETETGRTTREAVRSRLAETGELVQREYRDPAAMLDWIMRTPGYPERTIQVTAFGVPRLDYSGIASARFEGIDVDERPAEWRSVFTGLPGQSDFNDQRIGFSRPDGSTVVDRALFDRAVDRVFEPRTVTRYTLRWHK